MLDVLARQNQVLKNLTSNADTVIGDLADNKKDVGRFVKETEDVDHAVRLLWTAFYVADLESFEARLAPALSDLAAAS